MRPVFCLLLITGIPVVTSAQGYSMVRYDMKDGLPSSIVYGCVQDAYGFMWFATENGLCRFDGSHFKTFSTKDGLPDNSVIAIGADKTGRVFFNCFTHPPYIFYKDSIYPVKIDPRYISYTDDLLRYISMGKIFVFLGRRTFAIKGDSMVLLHDALPMYPENAMHSSGISENNFAYVLPVDTLVRVVNGKVVSRQHSPRLELDPGRKKNVPYITPTGKEIPMEEFNNNKLVLASSIVRNNEIFAIMGADTVTYVDMEAQKLLWKIAVPKPSNTFIDNEDNIWITTLGNGIYRIPSAEFKHIKPAGPSEIFSLSARPGGLMAGNDRNIVYNTNTADSTLALQKIDYSTQMEGSLNLMTRTSSNNRVMKIVSQHDTTYIGTDAYLLKKYGKTNSRSYPVFPIKDIDISNGTLFVCTGRNAVRIDAATMVVRDTIFPYRTTTGIVYDGDFYIGTQGGLAKVNLQTKEVISLNRLHPGLRLRITDFQPGVNDDIWAATSGSGLIQIRHDEIISVINEAKGLSSDICTSIFKEGNNLWVGTNKGLNKIDISTPVPRIISFTIANGLASDFVNTVFVDQQRVYVGSSEGLTYFDKKIENTKSICLLNIMQVSQGNHTLRRDSSYTFPHSALNIRIDFTAISFKSAGDNTYYYQLEGLDDEWNTTGNTFVNYATLPSGEYRFLVKAVNKFGVESEVRSISIIITPPWWQTGWFITLAGLAFASLVFFIYRRNINVIKKREKAKRMNEARFAALEQQALQAQMNPHFIFNCLNSIQSFILDFDAEGANQYLSAFASMIRQTLDISSHPLITIAEEVRYLDTYLQLEKLRFKEKFNYRIEVAEEIDTFGTWIPGMFMQPYIENSLRHGIQHRADNEGLITLSIQPLSDGGVVCRIIDNGIGRRKAGEMKSSQHIEYQSKGTFINSKRINAINNQFHTDIKVDIEDVIDKNGEVAGTQVSILIPQLRKP
ncbi:MAG TPA: histidine kinase [Chitinophagaceae bacterium]|jgi:outer membrane protein assembly factor BamB|nr:histidine kinase [Chitinophagaceae bacterium]